LLPAPKKSVDMPSTFGNHPRGVINNGETQKDRLTSDWKWKAKPIEGLVR
jgi:hypothetical protein